jgi:hypothetical protein
MSSVMVYFRVASQPALVCGSANSLRRTPLKEITMTQDHTSASPRPRLDDLLATMGVTPEQLMGMTADDLFAAATRWQDAATVAAEAQRFAPAVDRHLDTSST